LSIALRAQPDGGRVLRVPRSRLSVGGGGACVAAIVAVSIFNPFRMLLGEAALDWETSSFSGTKVTMNCRICPAITPSATLRKSVGKNRDPGFEPIGPTSDLRTLSGQGGLMVDHRPSRWTPSTA